MTTEDRQLTVIAAGVAVGGGYLVKVALDHLLGEPDSAAHRPVRIGLGAPLAVSLLLGVGGLVVLHEADPAFFK